MLEVCKDFPWLIPHKWDLIQSTGNAGYDAPTSRVEYLRGRYKEQQLSEKAIEFMFASWREKSSKAYDSQFLRWVSWCNSWGADSISCPISEVVNFLTDLFNDVGQHPLVSRLLKDAFHKDLHNPATLILGM